MLVRIFKAGTGKARSAVQYLMGNTDHTGKDRSVKPKILEGSPALFEMVADSTGRKHKYTSGAICFRDSERPSDAQIQQVIDQFRANFLPGLKPVDNYADLWIEHRDKGNVELHFVVAATEKSGKQLNIHPPGKRNIQHFEAFTQMMNHQLGYAQVSTDPFTIALNAIEAKTPQGKKAKRVKTVLNGEIKKQILNGSIANRDQLIEHLKDYGDITRVGDSYVSVQLPGMHKAQRLKGPLFEQGANYAALVQQFRAIQRQGSTYLTTTQAEQVGQRLQSLTQDRGAFFAKRYLTPKTSFRRGNKGSRIHRNVPEKMAHETAPIPAANPTPTSQAVMPTMAGDAQPIGKVPTMALQIGGSSSKNDDAQPDSGSDSGPLPASIEGLEKQMGSLRVQWLTLLFTAFGKSPAHAFKLQLRMMEIEAMMAALALRIQKVKNDAFNANPGMPKKPKI